MQSITTDSSIDLAKTNGSSPPDAEGLPLNALEMFAKPLLAEGKGIPDVEALLTERARNVADASKALASALRTIASGIHPEAPEAVIARKRAQAADDGYRVVLTPFSEIEAKLTNWLWEGRIPRAALTLIVGTEGLGKTAIELAFGADLTLGKLSGCFEGQPVNIALIAPEDDPERTCGHGSMPSRPIYRTSIS